MNHSAILKWIVDSSRSLPSPLEFDEDMLIDLVDVHNLSGRLMQRLRGRSAPRLTPKFKENLSDLYALTKRKSIQNVNAVRQIQDLLPLNTDVIIIKGVSTYVLVGQESIMRAGDIDVLSNNNSAVVDTLLNLDYQQTRAPFLHEVGEYTKDTIEVDVHDHFPVYSYTDLLLNANLTPSSNSGVWHQSYTMKQCAITYSDLRKHSYQGNKPDTMNITVADPNILAIIICAHAFMNYTNMWSISHREKAYVRLGEIGDLFELVNHPAFSAGIFLSLVERFEALDAVEWAANVTSVLFGKNPLPLGSSVTLGEELPNTRFPRCLWWNFWANLPSGTDELIQKWWLPMDRLTRELGHNKLTTHQGTSGLHSTIRQGGCSLLQRFITQEEYPIPLILEISTSETSLVININVLSNLDTDIDRIRIDFGCVASEWSYSRNDRNQTVVGHFPNVAFDDQGTQYQIRFDYSLELFGQSIKEMRKVALLVGVGKQSHNCGLMASTLIPMTVEL